MVSERRLRDMRRILKRKEAELEDAQVSGWCSIESRIILKGSNSDEWMKSWNE